MEETLCEVCRQPTKMKTDKLCVRCLVMEKQINYLIENKRETAREYLENKLQRFTNRRRRQILYSPLRRETDTNPMWRHTPDRRQIHKSSPLKRRKGDT